MILAHAVRVFSPWARGDREASRGARWRQWAAGVALGAAAIGVAYAYQRSLAAHVVPAGLLQLNGRIEGDEVTLGSKVPGRLQKLLAREGDAVHAGVPVATLEDGVARARLAQAVSARDVAAAKSDAARADLVLLRARVPIGIDAAGAELAASESTVQQARAVEVQAARERERAVNLRATGSLDDQAAERAALAHDTAIQATVAARAVRDKASAALRDAKLGPTQIRAKEAELAALEAAARQAQAEVDEAQTSLDDLTVLAPIDGTVTTRFVDVGQVIAAGTPIVEVVDLDRLYLKAFVSEADVGKVHLGLPARIYTDAFPDSPAAATVRYVASRAEFTPKEVQTRDERVKLVYTVKLYADENRDRRLVPGLSADAMVRFREDAAWTSPR